MTPAKTFGQKFGLAPRRYFDSAVLDLMKSESTQARPGSKQALFSMLTFVPASRIEAMMLEVDGDFLVESSSARELNGAGKSNGVANLNVAGSLKWTKKYLKLFLNSQPPDYWPKGPEPDRKPTWIA